MESQALRISAIPQFPKRTSNRRQQIEKAGSNRHTSTNDLVATNSSLTDWTPCRNELSQSYPIVSIVNIDNIVNRCIRLCCQSWVCERKAIPMRPTRWYSVISTPRPNDMVDMDFYPFFTREITMSTNTPKQPYEIIHHRRGLLVRIGGKYVPNRRGRPKHFVLHRHVQQYLQKVGVA
jgi:hypothetical protein